MVTLNPDSFQTGRAHKRDAQRLDERVQASRVDVTAQDKVVAQDPRHGDLRIDRQEVGAQAEGGDVHRNTQSQRSRIRSGTERCHQKRFSALPMCE